MTTDTKLQKLIINKLTTSEYSSINEKDPNQLYLVTDALGFDNTITNCLTHIPQDIKIEISDFSQGPYYGWINEDLSGYWTDTETPQVGGKLFLPNGQPTDASVFYEDTNATIVSYDPVGNTIEIEYRNLEEGTSITITTPRNSSYDVAGISEKKLVSKAGSKVWIPYGTTEAYKVGDVDTYGNTVVATSWDGSKFFYAIELQSDLTYSDPYNGNWIIVYCANDNTIKLAEDGGSGTTTPSGNGYYYNTSNNKIDYYRQTSATGWVCSFPLIKVTSTATQITSIDQVFNGFGYIGSTLFVLPGVKGLAPNGRNTDGSLKNIEHTFSKVLTRTFTGTASIDLALEPTYIGYANLIYDKLKNINYQNGLITAYCNCGSLTLVNGSITSLTPKTTFRAVDRNDTSWLSGLGMPSGKYIELTLGANGSSYTAPANGYFRLRGTGSSAEAYTQLVSYNGNQEQISVVPKSNSLCAVMIPVEKGEIVKAWYTTDSTKTYIRFIYAKGEN